MVDLEVRFLLLKVKTTPLSHFLFNLVVDILSRVVSTEGEKSSIEGFKVGRDSMHIFFTSTSYMKLSLFAPVGILMVFYHSLSLFWALRLLQGKFQCDSLKLDSWASLVSCEVSSFPSSYLRLALGSNLLR